MTRAVAAVQASGPMTPPPRRTFMKIECGRCVTSEDCSGNGQAGRPGYSPESHRGHVKNGLHPPGVPPFSMSPSDPPLTEAAPPAPPEPLAAKVASARAAQETWGLTPFEERVGCLLRAARAMLVRRSEAMALVEAEIGKVHAEALFTEALGPLDAVKGWAAVLGPALSRRGSAEPARLSRASAPTWTRCPAGVVAIIAPWNFPVAGLYRSVFPALMSRQRHRAQAERALAALERVVRGAAGRAPSGGRGAGRRR